MQDLLMQQLRKHWGYEAFRPLQREAIECVLGRRDSVVVLPTGGGKSICYQLPAVCHEDGLAVVVSPLISLMKDQVDSLVASGISAAAWNSMLRVEEKSRVDRQIRDGKLRLLYVSPERLVQAESLEMLQGARVRFFAIDEAHCISSWGHNFRPEYRQLRTLKERFPQASVHAFTATATPRVRQDIAEQLQLSNAEKFVGSFFRPNLRYSVMRRSDAVEQMKQIIDRYRGQSGIIYCISRRDVDNVAATLSALGYRVKPYHAGMSDELRNEHQEDFINERVDIMVATVAFGMGIDKSSVRYVIHHGMPKSLEAYQQESGRAGRDGLPSECCLLYSGRDLRVWKGMPDAGPSKKVLLEAIYGYCSKAQCRHRTLVEYFGQAFEHENCQACDVCLGDRPLVGDPLTVAQKILSCVHRVGQRFGSHHVAAVLTGSQNKRVLELGHEKLSTYKLLEDHKQRVVVDWIEQLLGQGYLEQVGEYRVLKITTAGSRVLRGEKTPRLLEPDVAKGGRSESRWELSDDEQGLFDDLRVYLRELAAARELPPFVIFHDGTLRDMARARPSDLGKLAAIPGVADKKLDDYGAGFVRRITEYCRRHDLDQDREYQVLGSSTWPSKMLNAAKQRAFEMFAAGESVELVAAVIGRAPSTTSGYMGEYIQMKGITDPSPWVDRERSEGIRRAAEQVESLDRLKPIREVLGEDYSFEEIRIVVECMRVETNYCRST